MFNKRVRLIKIEAKQEQALPKLKYIEYHFQDDAGDVGLAIRDYEAAEANGVLGKYYTLSVDN